MEASARIIRNEAEDVSKEKTVENKTRKANRTEGGETARGERTGAGQRSKKTVKSQACKEDQRGKGTRAEKVEGGKDKVSKKHRKTRKLRAGEAKSRGRPTNERTVATRTGRNELGRKPANARRAEINNYDKDEAGETWTGRTQAGEVGTSRKLTKEEPEEPSSPEVGRKAIGPKPSGGERFQGKPSGLKETGFAKRVWIGNSRGIHRAGIACGWKRRKPNGAPAS